jgi:hypothetical protein
MSKLHTGERGSGDLAEVPQTWGNDGFRCHGGGTASIRSFNSARAKMLGHRPPAQLEGVDETAGRVDHAGSGSSAQRSVDGARGQLHGVVRQVSPKGQTQGGSRQLLVIGNGRVGQVEVAGWSCAPLPHQCRDSTPASCSAASTAGALPSGRPTTYVAAIHSRPKPGGRRTALCPEKAKLKACSTDTGSSAQVSASTSRNHGCSPAICAARGVAMKVQAGIAQSAPWHLQGGKRRNQAQGGIRHGCDRGDRKVEPGRQSLLQGQHQRTIIAIIAPVIDLLQIGSKTCRSGSSRCRR